MKKPKKTSAAAKPRAGRVTGTRPISASKTAKAATGKAEEPSKKSLVKRAGKIAASKAEVAPEAKRVVPEKLPVKGVPAESKPAVKPPSPVKPEQLVETKTETALKPRRAKIKTAAKPKRALAAAPAPIQVKPVSLAGLVAEAKTSPEGDPISQMASDAQEAARAARRVPMRIPSILLEGDKPEATPVSGPGQRYVLAPTPPSEKLKTEGELPESYDTGEILLTARDPHWLYSHWDLSDDQQRRYNAFSRDGHLVVRVYIEAPRGKPAAEVHVHPESRHWFIHVERANTRYVAQLGYYSAAEKWKVVSTSCATLTPPDEVSPDTSAQFTSIPFEVPMEKLLSLVKEAVHEHAPLAEALQELRADGHPGLPQIEISQHVEAGFEPRGQSWSGSQWTPGEWTPAQERALAEVVSMDHVRRVWMGSLEITELIRRQLAQEAAPGPAGELGEFAVGAPTSPSEAITGISSPSKKEAGKPKGFWFNVNAELIVYGATERDATVSIGGRKIKLRADGSFSYRFALPDGNYEMPIVAISADESDGRAAELQFSRNTEYRGHVEAHPQDPALRQLALENF